MTFKSTSKISVGGPQGHSRHLGRSLAGLAMAAALTGVIATPAFAAPSDTDSGVTTGHVVVESGITLTDLSPSFTITGTPGATVGANVSYNVETNNAAGYGVTVQSESATMDPAGPSGDTIPIAALTAKDSTGATYMPVSSTVELPVHSQAVRSANTGDVLQTDFQMRVPTVEADTYSAAIDFVATSN